MGKFIGKVLIFLLLFIASNFLYLLLVQNFDWNYKKYLASRSLDSSKYDILVLGNSLSMDGINTEMIGRSYNLSIGGASLETSLFQLEEYLDLQETAPSTVILALGSNIDPELKKSNLHPIIQYEQGSKFDSFYDLPMLRFKWVAKELIKKAFSTTHREAYLAEGQLRISRIKPDRSQYSENASAVLDSEKYLQNPYIKTMGSLCKDSDIKLILLEMPGVKEEQNLIEVGPHSINEITLYNFNQKEFCEIFDSEKHWLGGSHLNSEGATIFTRKLIDLVEF